MWRDLERTCEALRLPLQRPQPFPQNSLLAARVALALDVPLRGRFSRAVYAAEFGEGRAIADRKVISELVADLGENAEATLARAETPENKAALKAACEEAKALGLPGAPVSVTEDGELFWGNDRLEQALDWAAQTLEAPIPGSQAAAARLCCGDRNADARETA